MTRLLTILILCLTGAAWAVAQTKSVSGLVLSDEDNEPVIGATVMVKGTTLGTVTDVDGRFSLSGVPATANAVVVSSVGLKSREVTFRGGETLRIILKSNAELLDEVVVTAMGITRQEKTLGYSATTVKSGEVAGARTSNVADALSGKVAGVQVNSTSSDPGSVSNIVIRGFSSINGSNQPLYIVDGVPLGSDLVSGGSSTVSHGKNVATAGISNIASEDIESMTILKGAAATALYGSRASNGVILITTKSGRKGTGGRNFTISYSGSVQARQVSLLPEFQNDFGQGWNGHQAYIENGSWGPAMDGSEQVYGPIWNGQQLSHKFSAVEDNVKDFFDIGWSHNHNVSFGGASADNKTTYYLSYSYTSDDGIMPTDADKYVRNTLAFRSSFEATEWLKLSSAVNYATTSTDAVGTYQGTTVMCGLYELPRDISLEDKKDLSSPFNTPEAYFTHYHITNPYWALANNYNHTSAKQIYGKIQADITPMEQLKLTYRFGFDYSDYDNKVGYPELDIDDSNITEDYGFAPSNMNQSGFVYARYGRRYELNHDFLANFTDRYFDDKLEVSITAGANINERYTTMMAGQTDNLTIATGFWDLSNGATRSELTERQTKRRLIGLFGDVTIGYRDMLYLGLTARNDWSSTLPIDGNSFFYPGVTLSWVFTRLIPENDILSFGKLRWAYGKTGNDANVYQTSVSYVQAFADGYYGSNIASFPLNSINASQLSSIKGSSNLKPEMTTEFEAGLNLQFFGGRIGLDAAFYRRTTDNQIINLPTDAATGYLYITSNFGKIRNSGLELVLTTVPVKTKNLTWELALNFSKNNNKVVSLPSNFTGGKVPIYSYIYKTDAVYMYAEEGRPLGEFYTYLPTYTADGKIIVDTNGQPVLTTTVEDTGKNINPDWTGGVTTSLTYRDFTLSAALDIRKGGYMFSRTRRLTQYMGNSIVTTYNSRHPFVIPNSVVANGDGTYSENTTPIIQADGTMQYYYEQYGYGQGGEALLVDKSFVKLRNISLTWNVPQKWVSAMQLSDLSLTLFCNNVFTWTASDNYFIDPESTSISQADYGDLGTQFGEMYANPSCRIFGCNLSVKF